MVVQSPKTESHPGKDTRTIPLFPELRQYLEESFDLAEDGTVYVVEERFRKAALGPGGWANANLRTTFTKIVQRAGLQPWPRLFHNLRASRETELAETYPVQVVTSWLGNTPNIAMKHYLMTTGEHFARAIDSGESDNQVEQTLAETGSAQAAQKAAQQAHAATSNEQNAQGRARKKPGV